jgi:hypothetical protein
MRRVWQEACRTGELPPAYYITCAGRTDGGGAQMQAIYSTLLYARCAGLIYLHTPIFSVEHNTYDEPDWPEKWERAFSPGHGELQAGAFDLSAARQIPANEMSFEHPPPPPPQPTLLVAQECHWYADSHPDFYSLIQPLLIRKYRLNSPPKIENRDRLIVAIHIRRGDVDEHEAERFTCNEWVDHQIDELSRSLGSVRHEFHVYSEGAEEDFGAIGDRAVLHLNGDVFECFESLVSADIFVTAKSSFSYTAALLARGVVIYSPFWHAPLQQWIVVGEQGEVCRNRLLSSLWRQRLMKGGTRIQ